MVEGAVTFDHLALDDKGLLGVRGRALDGVEDLGRALELFPILERSELLGVLGTLQQSLLGKLLLRRAILCPQDRL
jgi:hypothetical protein